MKKHKISNATTLRVNESVEGQRIEDQVERLLNNNEPLPADSPLIYSERERGVEPEYDITADRHEVILDAMNVVEKTVKAKRQNKVTERQKLLDNLKAKETGGQSTEGNQGDQGNN